MRLFTVGCAVLFVSSLAVGQTSPIHGYAGYGYGPYVPMLTTPEISLQSVPTTSPVGASNATAGLQAGARRSQAVRSFLASRGIDASRMRTISYGKERPVAVCNDISCWSQNRRAVTVLNASS